MAESTLTTPSVSRLAPASGSPKLSSWRAWVGIPAGQHDERRGTLAAMRAAVQPATEPQAKLIAPRAGEGQPERYRRC